MDGRFFRPFARLHPTGNFPSFSVAFIGIASAFACLLQLDVLINALIVHASDVTEAGAERIAGGRSLLAVPEFATAYGLKQEVVYHLVKVGLLRTVEDGIGRRAARFIEPAEATRFHSDVTSLADVARAAGAVERSMS